MTADLTLKEKVARMRPKGPPTLLNGDLILSRESSFFSWLVRKATKSEWSHVSIVVKPDAFPQPELPNDFEMVCGAIPFKGVIVFDYATIATKAVYRIKDATDDQRKRIAQFCLSKRGDKYDFVQGALLAYRIFTDKLDTNAGDPSPKKYVCSELAAEACASVGVYFGKIVDNVLPSTISRSPLVEKVL